MVQKVSRASGCSSTWTLDRSSRSTPSRSLFFPRVQDERCMKMTSSAMTTISRRLSPPPDELPARCSSGLPFMAASLIAADSGILPVRWHGILQNSGYHHHRNHNRLGPTRARNARHHRASRLDSTRLDATQVRRKDQPSPVRKFDQITTAPRRLSSDLREERVGFASHQPCLSGMLWTNSRPDR